MPRNEAPAPFPETVIRSSLGGGSSSGGGIIGASRGEGGVSTFPVKPPSTNRTPLQPNKKSPLPGDVIQQLQMKVGAEIQAPAGGSTNQIPPIRDNGALVGRGSTLLSSSAQDAAPNKQFQSVPRSLDRSNAILQSRPNDLRLGPDNTDYIAKEALVEDVIVKEAYKEDNSIIIKWDSETTNILGFRVIYRLFGTPQFKQGPPLAPSEREFKIKNVPDNVSQFFKIICLK